MIRSLISVFCLRLPLIPEGILSTERGWGMALCSEMLNYPSSEAGKRQHREPPNESLHFSTLRINYRDPCSKNTPIPFVVQ